MKNKLFRLGAQCLVLLMITATLLVGGSFSKITSEGSTTEFPPLTVANFDVEIAEEPLTDDDRHAEYALSDHQLVVCAFTITNNSDVDIIIDDLVFKTGYTHNYDERILFYMYVDVDDKLYQLNVEDDSSNLICPLKDHSYYLGKMVVRFIVKLLWT